MNILEKLMKILEKSRKALPFSQEDKKIIKEISQCNNSYYRMRILDILKYELEDWSYDILKRKCLWMGRSQCILTVVGSQRIKEK